jgi:5-methylcytosine-specific restriction protein A
MPRSTPEWIGKSDDAAVPPRVKMRVFLRQDGRCAGCTRKLGPGDRKTCDHVKPLILGGENREGNLQTLGEDCCGAGKTRADVAAKSRVYGRAARHAGFATSRSRPLPGTKRSGWKHRMDGTWTRRS